MLACLYVEAKKLRDAKAQMYVKHGVQDFLHYTNGVRNEKESENTVLQQTNLKMTLQINLIVWFK